MIPIDPPGVGAAPRFTRHRTGLTRAGRFVLAGLLLALTACGAPPQNSPAADRPVRIISCAPNLTEMLFALGAGDRVVGVTRYCRFPAEARERPPLGDLYQPDLEAIVAARPDLIVLVPGNRKIQEFFGPRGGTELLETNACETIDDILATIRQLGRATGDSSRAETVMRGIRTGLDSLSRAWEDAPPVRYLLVLGHDEGALEQIYVTGQANFLTELATLSGGENVVHSNFGRYPILNREALVALNPAVIIEQHLGEPPTEAERAFKISLWKQMPTLEAVRRDRVVLFNDDHITIPGTDLVRTARVLASLLHEEAPE